MSKVFDVSRPGTTPANPTSKPVIMGAPVQDPSITLNGVGDRRLAPAASPRKIEISDSPAPAAPVETSAAPAEESFTLPSEPEPASAPAPAPEVPEAPQEEAQAIADTALTETVSAPDVPTDQQLSEADLHEASAPSPQLQLPPHYHTSPWRTIFLILLTLLLAAAIFDVLLDADMVMVDGIPHTNYF